jgi:hypothetical protein
MELAPRWHAGSLQPLPESAPHPQTIYVRGRSGYIDQEFVIFIFTMLVPDFCIGFEPAVSCKENIPSAMEYPDVVQHYLGDGRSMRRILGPLPKGVVPAFQVNRFSQVPYCTPGKLLPFCCPPTILVLTTASISMSDPVFIRRWIVWQELHID